MSVLIFKLHQYFKLKRKLSKKKNQSNPRIFLGEDPANKSRPIVSLESELHWKHHAALYSIDFSEEEVLGRGPKASFWASPDPPPPHPMEQRPSLFPSLSPHTTPGSTCCKAERPLALSRASGFSPRAILGRHFTFRVILLLWSQRLLTITTSVFLLSSCLSRFALKLSQGNRPHFRASGSLPGHQRLSSDTMLETRWQLKRWPERLRSVIG